MSEHKTQTVYQDPRKTAISTRPIRRTDFAAMLWKRQIEVKRGFEARLRNKDYRNEEEGREIAHYLENVNMALLNSGQLKLENVACRACGWADEYFVDAPCPECLEILNGGGK